MDFKHINLQDFMSVYHPLSPEQEMLDAFSLSLRNYLVKIADSKASKESQEEFEKNLLRDFLKEIFDYDCNTKGKIDLAIYDDSSPKVLFEVKSSSNAQEFVKDSTSLESKAFYESILYYLRESITNANNNITHIILSNAKDFYLINANEYLVFAKDKMILKAFKNCQNKEGNDPSTARFYDELAKILPCLDLTLPYTYFRLDKTLLESTSSLPLLYQVLSPQVLLKRKNYLDANTLNQNFYDELLHILGLKENLQNSKVIIQPSSTSNTLLDSLCAAFELDRDKDFEEIFSLLMTWNNRILFLRLLESMLLGFEHIKKPFLDLDSLPNFQMLNTLFFDILAKLEDKREVEIPKALANIPYLNSSLFDKTPLEIEGKEIKLLDSKPLKLYADSILYKDKNFCMSLNLDSKTKDSTLPLLEYLFAFLHAYNFTTTAKDIQNYTKMNFDKLINSAVLGLVFEKLNGYKEGSFYTPSFITRYMCKQSLEKVVLQKFNECKNWDCQNLEELKTRLDKLTDSKEGYKEANTIFDSIKICDPAVGSGHFLVSALNEMIALKFELRILCDENNERLKDIDLKVINDEIVIRDSVNALFTYTLPKHENIETHKIQKALFSAKRKLIESCLFGVDINPNSCEITKLRLWIELLKYSYYKDIPNKRLETLPNIDINIKCGNSLISRFNLSDSLKTIPNINAQIKKYKQLVFDYKNADQAIIKISKDEIESQIEAIKRSFTLTLKDPKTKKELEKAIKSHIEQFNDYLLDDSSLLDGLNSLQFNVLGTPNLNEEEEARAFESYGKIQALRKKLDLTLSGAEYKNAFEWRFAFPEVLDSNGDFLGFDLVIGNPPYVVKKKIEYPQYKWNADLYMMFFEKGFTLTKQNGSGLLNFITPRFWLVNANCENMRKYFLESIHLISLSETNPFERAITENIISEFQICKPKLNTINYYKETDEVFNFINIICKEDFKHNFKNEIILGLNKEMILLFDKICKNTIYLESISESKRGAEYGKKFCQGFSRGQKVLLGYDLSPYCIQWENTYINEKLKDIIRLKSFFDSNNLIYLRRVDNRLTASVSSENFAFIKNIYGIRITNKKYSHLFILALLNSKLLNFYYLKKFTTKKEQVFPEIQTYLYEKLPIPKITKQNQKIANKIITLVDEILKLKAKDSTTNTSTLESEIDSLVYRLYNLSDEEIKIIER